MGTPQQDQSRGPLDHPERIRHRKRVAFLEAVEQHTLAVVELRDDVFPVFTENPADFEKWRKPFFDWATRSALLVDWMYTCALATLFVWKFADVPREAFWLPLGLAERRDWRAFDRELREHYNDLEIEVDVRRSKTLEQCLGRTEAAWRELVKRQRDDGFIQDRSRNLHVFEWLARYQVNGQTAADIAGMSSVLTVAGRTHRASRETVLTSVRRLANEIGLPLRPGDGRGRPKKNI